MKNYYVCLEIGGTHTRIGIVSDSLKVLEFEKIPTYRLSEASNKIGFLVAIIKPLIEKIGPDKISAISLALASLMDRDRTTVYSSPMIKGFNNLPLRDQLSTHLGLPVIMEKDVNLLLLYETHKQNLPVRGITAGFFLGTGLGNAICINGQVYPGFSGTACELGHIPVSEFNDECGCGKTGCIELKASGRILTELAKTKNCQLDDLFGKHGRDADIESVIYHFAVAIATEVCILDPSCILLGGGVLEINRFPLNDLLMQIKMNLRSPYPRNSIHFAFSSGDAEAGIVGATIHAKYQLSGGINP